MASVRPSARYSWSASPLSLANGSTASDSIGFEWPDVRPDPRLGARREAIEPVRTGVARPEGSWASPRTPCRAFLSAAADW
jgi:hypothetical protein